MSMDFFRRPLLAGKALKRNVFAMLRGSVRRSDPDGSTYNVPFFKDVATNDTLILKIDGVQLPTIFFPDGSLTGVIDTLNTALNPSGPPPNYGKAFDTDGSLTLQTLSSGGGGSVEVVGGTAAAALGFDLSTGRLFARGGDLASSPEGRVGNGSAAAFPLGMEGLNTDSFVRALGRLSSNSDVLHAELMRQHAKLAYISTISSSTPIGSACAEVALPVGTRIFTGLGLLSDTPTPEELSAFFVLIDPATGLPSVSRVVAIVKGSMSGAPPYANATSAGGSGNVASLNLVRLSGLPIQGIVNGRVITISSGGSSLKVGDFANINGADNTINREPWDHRGFRWVVEEVIDDQHVALRPMAPSEMALVGYSSDDAQPIIELNETIYSGQVYGTVDFYAGPFLDGCSLIISPPLPPSTQALVYGAVPMTYRGQTGYEDLLAHRLANAASTSAQDSIANAILTRPTMAVASNQFQMGAFNTRWHGRLVHISPTNLAISAPGSSVYWDEADGTVHITTGAPPSTAHLIATGVSQAGAYTSACRIEAAQARTLTVGSKGQFPDLSSALAYLGANVGVIEQCQLLVLESETAPAAGWPISVGVTIRGVDLDVTLTHNGSMLFTSTCSAAIVLEDLTVDLSKTLVSVTSGSPDIRYRNLRGTGVTGQRSIDSLSTDTDIGASSPKTWIGKAGNYTEVRGRFTVDQDAFFHGSVTVDYSITATSLTVNNTVSIGNTLHVSGIVTFDNNLTLAGDLNGSGNVTIPNSKKVQVGAQGSAAGAALQTDGVQGSVVLTKAGEAAVSLRKDDLDLLVNNVDANDVHIHDARYESTAAPGTIGTSNVQGSSTKLSRQDHSHDHGAQSTPTHHAVATPTSNGFLSSSDKAKLDGISSSAAALSSSTPVAVTTSGTGAVGTGTTAARADHVHAIQYASAGQPGILAAADYSSFANKQNALGYTPVRQGGGISQAPNQVNIGWDGSRLRATIDAWLDLGQLLVTGDAASPSDVTAALQNYARKASTNNPSGAGIGGAAGWGTTDIGSVNIYGYRDNTYFGVVAGGEFSPNCTNNITWYLAIDGVGITSVSFTPGDYGGPRFMVVALSGTMNSGWHNIKVQISSSQSGTVSDRFILVA